MKTLFALMFAAVATTSMAATTYNVVPSESKITYVGKKVTGEHTGNVTIQDGTLVFDGEKLTGGTITADMKTLSSTDITDPEYNKKYVGHMKSADFFDTEKHPVAKLAIKSSKKTKKGLEVTGDLTMVGQTRPVTFMVNDLKKTDSKVTGSADLKLDRTKWGLKYGSGSFFKGLGDKAINDDFTLNVKLTATK